MLTPQTLAEHVRQIRAELPPLRVVVIYPERDRIFQALAAIMPEGWVQPLLLAPCRVRDSQQTLLPEAEWIECNDSHQAALRAITLAHEENADVFMRGDILARDAVRALLDHDFVRRGQTLSHVALLEREDRPEPFLLSDATVFPDPEIADLVGLVTNAVGVGQRLGQTSPRVALLSAVETVSWKMSAAVKQTVVAMMAQRGQLGDYPVDGPLSLDVAVSPDIARDKKVHSPIAGTANVLIGPGLTVTASLYQSMTLFAGFSACGVLVGGQVPVAFQSCSDGVEGIANSLRLAALLATPQAS